jgi:hypothetical protein
VGNLNRQELLTPLSLLSFSLLPLFHVNKQSAAASNFAAAAGRSSPPSSLLAFPEGSSSLLTKYILFKLHLVIRLEFVMKFLG